MVVTYSMLEASKVSRTQSICLGYHRDEIDSGAETLHDFNVQGFQGMSRGADEVEADVHTKIDLVNSSWLLLLQHVRLMLVVEELNDGHP